MGEYLALLACGMGLTTMGFLLGSDASWIVGYGLQAIGVVMVLYAGTMQLRENDVEIEIGF